MDEQITSATRHERRQAARLQREGGGHSGLVRRTLLWTGLVVVLVAVIWGMTMISKTPAPATDGILDTQVSAEDYVLGPASASVTLVEYSDFQCPACAGFAPIVKKAMTEPELAGRVRLVYRAFPLTTIHQRAELAARAAQAASLQGKFWEMHDALFAGQAAWAQVSEGAARDVFRGYASSIGLDVTQFVSSLDSASVRDFVQAQLAEGELEGVDSTPTFYVNGKRMAHPQSYEEFRQFLIDASHANP